jgi:hypothetical protein
VGVAIIKVMINGHGVMISLSLAQYIVPSFLHGGGMDTTWTELTRTMYREMARDARRQGYIFNSDFIRAENIGDYYPRIRNSEFGAIKFRTPELKTFYLLRWS